jgi:hypothetical protein
LTPEFELRLSTLQTCDDEPPRLMPHVRQTTDPHGELIMNVQIDLLK